MRSVAPISIPETSRSRCSGTSSGSASTVTSRSGCESTPPSRTPGASSPPTSWTVTEAWIGWSSRTSCRSTCVTPPRTGSTWYSLRIDAWVFALAVDLDVEDRVQAGRHR